jgi:hypothetical protein
MGHVTFLSPTRPIEGGQAQDEEGDEEQLLQLKFWTRTLESWSMVIYDRLHNPVALVGPTRVEKQCWNAVVSILKRKGYWGGDLEE